MKDFLSEVFMGRSLVVKLCVGAGLAVAAFPQPASAATTLEMQVSRATLEDWHPSINALPGDSIDIRVRVSYTGGPTPLGFSSAIFQPTVSRWNAADALTALVNNGVGGQQTIPIGAVPDVAGQYGRVMPFAQVGLSTANRLRGHVNTVSGTTYLRIAQDQVTGWIGDAGNVTGGSGVNLHQANVNNAERGVYPLPAFNSNLTNVVLFKFNIVLGASGVRTLVADIPLAGVYEQPNPYVGWYANPTEDVGSIRDLPTVVPAQIHVLPAPSSLVCVGLLLGAARRRRA
jgi:hypothetical protein